MKKLVFGLIATVMFSLVGNAQTDSKMRYKICATVSCCGIGIFSVDVWSQTSCYEYSSGKVILNFKDSTKNSEVVIDEDLLLVGLKSEKGEDLILQKGKYPILDNEFSFIPITTKATVHCIKGSYSGSIFGHEYSGGTSYCWTWIWDSKSTNSNLIITPELSLKDKEQLNSGNTDVTLDKDVVLKDGEVDYIVKAGKYILNQDGNIYLQNIKRK